jgi:hypothetical protein
MLRTSVRLASLSLALALTNTAALAQVDPTAEVARVLASPAFKAAASFLDKEHGRIVDEGIKLTEIPAPPFFPQASLPSFADCNKSMPG